MGNLISCGFIHRVLYNRLSLHQNGSYFLSIVFVSSSYYSAFDMFCRYIKSHDPPPLGDDLVPSFYLDISFRSLPLLLYSFWLFTVHIHDI